MEFHKLLRRLTTRWCSEERTGGGAGGARREKAELLHGQTQEGGQEEVEVDDESERVVWRDRRGGRRKVKDSLW